jgi:enterochelin esterase-like enzyme
MLLATLRLPIALLAFAGWASAATAADSISGDWKLNLSKSSAAAANGAALKDGRALIESDNAGGYFQFSETFFAGSAAPLRFTNRVQLDGTPGDASFEDRPVQVVCKRTGPQEFDIAIRDPKTQRVLRTLRGSLSPGSQNLTMRWLGPASEPLYTLVYDRLPAGPVLETGKRIEREFGPASVDEYRVHLQAGQYCVGKVDQKGGTINMAGYGPDGARIRGFGGPPTGEKLFALEAPVTGDYRIALRSAEKPATSYTISLDEISGLEGRPQGQPSKQKFPSPRIEQLRKDLEAGAATDTVAAFWKEIELKGTPLVEELKDNSTDNLVTLLWRASPVAPTRNVMIVWFPYAAAKPNDYLMTNLAATDVWYRTLKIRRGARFAYQLSPNDPATFDDPPAYRISTVQADPLNPHHWFDNPGSTKFEYSSSVELPGARPQPYSTKRAAVPAGKVEKARIKSELLGNERDLSIYTPPGYSKEGSTPNGLLVVFDESAYLTMVPTPVILDNLLADGKIRPMVAVLIANPSQETRNRELPPNPKFADFLNDELIPWVRRNYNVTKDPSQVVVAGSSYGGIASVYAGLRHPETFGNILCQSGSFWWSASKPEPYAEPNYLAREFLKSPKLPLRFYMDAGSFEVDLNGGGGAILEPSRHMRDVLLAKGYEVHYQENVGGHDYLSWKGSLADGLLALVGVPNRDASAANGH